MKLGKKFVFLKKAGALLTASALLAAPAAPTTVWAADTYVDIERENLAKFSAAAAKDLKESQDSLGDAGITSAGAVVDMSLKLEDAGRSLLSLLIPEDISWLNNIGLRMNASVETPEEGMREYVDTDLYLNDSNICKFLLYMDMVSMMEYVQIPELSPSFLMVNLDEAVTMTYEDGTTQTYSEFMESISNPQIMLNSTDSVEDLLNRYGGIILDAMEEGPSGAEAVSVEGISEDCTVYEGRLYEDKAEEMAKTLLTTAKEDEQLKELIESSASEGTEDPYGDFQASIDELLADLEENTTDSAEVSEEYISSQIWINGEGEIVGRQLSFGTETEKEGMFTYQQPSKDGTDALLLEFSADGDDLTVVGQGTKEDTFNGSYDLALNSVVVATLTIEDLNTDTATGTFTLTPAASEDADDAAAIMSNFSLILQTTYDESSETYTMSLTITSGGAPLGSLNISVTETEAQELPDPESFTPVYDANNDEDAAAYEEEITYDTIIENCKAAGVPEEVAEDLRNALEGVEEEVVVDSAAEPGAEPAPADEAASQAEPAPAEETTEAVA